MCKQDVNKYQAQHKIAISNAETIKLYLTLVNSTLNIDLLKYGLPSNFRVKIVRFFVEHLRILMLILLLAFNFKLFSSYCKF